MAKKDLIEKAPSDVPSVLNFEADAGAGLEHADRQSYAIPFLTVLQGQSPQLETVEGARPGRFFNPITKEVSDSVTVVPCYFKRSYLRWAPRTQGGGFRGEVDAQAVDTRKVDGLSEHKGVLFMDVPPGVNPFDADGKPAFDTLSDTRHHFVLVKSASGLWQPALLSLKSTQIKKSKRWVSLMDGLKLRGAGGTLYTPATYSHLYHITPVKEENNEGAWWGVDVNLIGPVTEPVLYASGKAFHDQILAGHVKTEVPHDDLTGKDVGF